MTFILSKILWIIAAPDNLAILLLCAGTVMMLFRHTLLRRAGQILTGMVTLCLLIVAVLPVGVWLIAPLENRFPRPDLPNSVQGIIVLGGAVDQIVTAARDDPALTEAAERMTTFYSLARRYPDARLIFTGGSGLLGEQGLKETDAARLLFVDRMGLDPARILFEGQSRNTYENAIYSMRQAHPRPGETWILVTSGFHMPRSMGVFRQAGWDVIPYPTDFRTAPSRHGLNFNLGDGLTLTRTALREWVGLGAYHLMGRTSSLFPGPDRSGIKSGLTMDD